MTYWEIRNKKKVEELMIQPDGVKRKLDGVVDTWKELCGMLDGELTHE